MGTLTDARVILDSLRKEVNFALGPSVMYESLLIPRPAYFGPVSEWSGVDLKKILTPRIIQDQPHDFLDWSYLFICLAQEKFQERNLFKSPSVNVWLTQLVPLNVHDRTCFYPDQSFTGEHAVFEGLAFLAYAAFCTGEAYIFYGKDWIEVYKPDVGVFGVRDGNIAFEENLVTGEKTEIEIPRANWKKLMEEDRSPRYIKSKLLSRIVTRSRREGPNRDALEYMSKVLVWRFRRHERVLENMVANPDARSSLIDDAWERIQQGKPYYRKWRLREVMVPHFCTGPLFDAYMEENALNLTFIESKEDLRKYIEEIRKISGI